MKKSDIIALVTILVIFAGIFSNGMVLRNKFFKGEFDDPYKKGIKAELPTITSVCFLCDSATSSSYRGGGGMSVIHDDAANQILLAQKEISYETAGEKLLIVKRNYDNQSKILLSALEEVDVLSNQFVKIENFDAKNLRIVADNEGSVTLLNCHIENLVVEGNGEARITVASTSTVQNLDLKLSNQSTFVSCNVSYENFIYDIDDDCSLNLSGKSLDVLKQKNTESDE